MTPRGLSRSPRPPSNAFPVHMTEEEIIFNDASIYDQEMYGYQDQPPNTYMYPLEYEYDQQFDPTVEYKDDESLDGEKKETEQLHETLAIENGSKND